MEERRRLSDTAVSPRASTADDIQQQRRWSTFIIVDDGSRGSRDGGSASATSSSSRRRVNSVAAAGRNGGTASASPEAAVYRQLASKMKRHSLNDRQEGNSGSGWAQPLKPAHQVSNCSKTGKIFCTHFVLNSVVYLLQYVQVFVKSAENIASLFNDALVRH